VLKTHFKKLLSIYSQKQKKKGLVRERYTAVWVKKNGRWQLVAEQGNFIKQQ
jgi:hypothetical protein